MSTHHLFLITAIFPLANTLELMCKRSGDIFYVKLPFNQSARTFVVGGFYGK